MRIAVGSDHAGYRYKELLKAHLAAQGHDIRDFGTDSPNPVDYPRFVRPVAEAVRSGACDRGIVIGGSGNGEAIVANRMSGIRCTLCWNDETARLARAHNNANVLPLGERQLSEEDAIRIVDIWMQTDFEGGRHRRRVELIDGGRTED